MADVAAELTQGCRADSGVAHWWETTKAQHPQHWLTHTLAVHLASSARLGEERLSIRLLPRTAGSHHGLSQDLADGATVQQLAVICNGWSAVATPEQVLLLTTSRRADAVSLFFCLFHDRHSFYFKCAPICVTGLP